MEKSKIEVLMDSVMDGTVDIEQVWQTYGNQIRGTSKANTEREAMALVALYFRFGKLKEKQGFLKDALLYCKESLDILDKNKHVVSESQFKNAREAIVYSLAILHKGLDDYLGSLKNLKQLREMSPNNDEYRMAYIGCMGSVFAKYTMPIYIILGLLFLLKMGEVYLFHTHYIPKWLIDVAWVTWLVVMIIQFGMPWVLKKFMK